MRDVTAVRGRPGAATARATAARAVTEVFAPTVVLASGYLAVAAGSAPTPASALGYGLLAAFLGSVLPFLFVVAGVRRGRISDHHIRVRGQRHIPLVVGFTCVLGTFALLVALSAPRPLLVLFGLVIGALLPAMAITLWWQISVHTAVAALTITVLIVVWGPWLTPALAVVVAVGWSRVTLDAHTVAQVWAGGFLGAAIGALAWPLLG